MSLLSRLFPVRRRSAPPSVCPRLEILEDRLVFSVNFTEYPVPTAGTAEPAITAGPDGALWFTEDIADKIGRISMGGSVTEFAIPTSGAAPSGITAGPDGALWFTEDSVGKIGRITTGGTITEFVIPASGSHPDGITAGPDGTLWFTDPGTNSIGRITTGGSATEFTVPTSNALLGRIAAGSDGALWFTEDTSNFSGPGGGNQVSHSIGRITTGGSVTEFPVGGGLNQNLNSITSGPDGALWFTASESYTLVGGDYGSFYNSGYVGRITTGGAVTTFYLPYAPGPGNGFVYSEPSPDGITTGPDGALWFTVQNERQVDRITTAGSITENDAAPGTGITLGPDGALWFTEGNIGRLALSPDAGVPPAPPTPFPPSAFPLGANVAGVGTPVVDLTNNGALVYNANPFPSFGGDVRRAAGVLPNGDQLVVWAAGPGGGPDVQVVDATAGRVLADFFAFDPSFAGGVSVAVADVNHDGTPDIIVGAGAGGGPEVRVIDGTKLAMLVASGPQKNEIQDQALLADFFAFDPSFAGGVTVAAADFDGDGRADVVVGAGPGGGPEVKVVDGAKLNLLVASGPQRNEIEDGALLADFFAFDPSFAGGVSVAAGDVNHDGVPDLVAGAGAGGGPEVKVIDGTKLGEVVASGPQRNEVVDAALLGDFLAYAPGFAGGVRVDAVDVNGDGRADVVTGAGPGGGAEVKVVDSAKLGAVVPQGQPQAGEIQDGALLDDFLARPDDPNGAFV